MEKVVAGVKVHITSDPVECWDMIDLMTVCGNCMNLRDANLFTGYCEALDRQVEADNTCECFYGGTLIQYWVGKLVQSAMDADGHSDEVRAWGKKEGLI